MITGLLAAISASAAAGLRIALPLLVIGLLEIDRLWSNVPLLSYIHPPVLLGILTSWSLFELFGSKKLLGQRVLQVVQLCLSPVVGALMSIAVARTLDTDILPIWIVAIIGGLFAFVLQLVQIGWFFRLRGLPIWAVILEDALCICLVLFAFKAPREGGLIAMLLLWLAIRSSKAWHEWYRGKRREERSPS